MGVFCARLPITPSPFNSSWLRGHTEFLSLFLVNSPSHPFLLGLPWLIRHNPQIDWAAGEVGVRVVSQSASPQNRLLHLHSHHSLWLLRMKISRTSRVFLLLGSSPPRGWLYSLSALEKEARQMTLTLLWTQGSSVHLLYQRKQCSSSWIKKIRLSDPASTIEA